jgi:DNA-binding NarL/FixJ family response regulator
MSASSKPTIPNSVARIRAAIDDVLRHPTLNPPRQSAPTPAIARQTTPLNSLMQNEPTSLPNRQPSTAIPAHPPHNPRQSAPNPAIARRLERPCKSNPEPRTPRPLTPNHLRAARLLVAGQTTTAIAAALGLDRHTVSQWKRLPAFQREIRDLIDASQ